jgi:hypothetical protein
MMRQVINRGLQYLWPIECVCQHLVTPPAQHTAAALGAGFRSVTTTVVVI